MKQILSLLVFIFLLQQFIQAQTPALVKDILPGKNGSEPKELISIGNTLYFSADDSTYGRELWRSNGTTSNTIMVRDISPGTRSGFERTAFPQFLTNLNGTLYFGAREYQYGDEIWKSDGTTSGTVMIKDINVGDPWSRSLPRYLTVIGNTIYFSAFTYKYGTELWKTDGTESGTVQVKDIREGGTPFGESSFPREYTVLNNTLYFTVNPAYWVEALMKSDGTGGGTEPVKIDTPMGIFTKPEDLTLSGNQIFFFAEDNVNGRELWRTDGTMNGTKIVKDIFPGILSSSPTNLFNVAGTVYFSANDSIFQAKTIKSIDTVLNDTVFNYINIGDYNRELWKSNGTAAGTMMVKDINLTGDSSTRGSSYPQNLINVGNTLYFTANDGINGRELWKSDGTGTVMVKDIFSGSQGSYPHNLKAIGSKLYFSANDSINGDELWRTDGTLLGTVLVADINPGSSGSDPAYITASDSALFFTADDGVNGRELWKIDHAPGVGIESIEIIPQILIYPNPSQGQVTIQFNSKENERVELRVFNIFGKEIYQESFQLVRNQQILKDINLVHSGLYILELKMGERSQTRKVIIQ